MESDLIEFIFQKHLSDLNRTGLGFGKTDADELNLMMIKTDPGLNAKAYACQRQVRRVYKGEIDVDMIMMIDFRNVLIPMNYVINPTLILKRGYNQIFHRIIMSYRSLKTRFDQLMINFLKYTKSVGGKTSSKVGDKHGKLLGLFSSSDDNDGCLNPRPERQRRFEERKLIEIVRFVENPRTTTRTRREIQFRTVEDEEEGSRYNMKPIGKEDETTGEAKDEMGEIMK
ncbi:hypothetical protein PPACK8108_LOCUS10709 [Phakopsora pachyrhizi]|uniref:Uncharacterized protein n=1 Tax=Phakopsora pachyrhizi TaxID=170000 RepID=A0AAV0B1T3_PHAPC|nr:hypothetical protein PPACK8108_LOCUS10709 [Phakopsora pachyrhizi]